MIASIIFVFLILNHKRLIMGINPKYVKYQLNDPKITYDKMLRIGIIELQERIEVEAASNQQKIFEICLVVLDCWSNYGNAFRGGVYTCPIRDQSN